MILSERPTAQQALASGTPSYVSLLMRWQGLRLMGRLGDEGGPYFILLLIFTHYGVDDYEESSPCQFLSSPGSSIVSTDYWLEIPGMRGIPT